MVRAGREPEDAFATVQAAEVRGGLFVGEDLFVGEVWLYFFFLVLVVFVSSDVRIGGGCAVGLGVVFVLGLRVSFFLVILFDFVLEEDEFAFEDVVEFCGVEGAAGAVDEAADSVPRAVSRVESR